MVKLKLFRLLICIVSSSLWAQCLKFEKGDVFHPEVLEALPSDFGESTDVDEKQLIPTGAPEVIENPKSIGTPKHFEKKVHHLVPPHTVVPETTPPASIQLQPAVNVTVTTEHLIVTTEQEAAREEEEAEVENIQSTPNVTIKILKSPWQEPPTLPNELEAKEPHDNEISFDQDVRWEEIEKLLTPPETTPTVYVKFENVPGTDTKRSLKNTKASADAIPLKK